MENTQWEAAQTQESPRAHRTATEPPVYKNPMQITLFILRNKLQKNDEINNVS